MIEIKNLALMNELQLMIDDTEQVAGKWDENDESGRCHKCGPITVISSVIENSRACHHGITGHESHSTAIQPNG